MCVGDVYMCVLEMCVCVCGAKVSKYIVMN